MYSKGDGTLLVCNNEYGALIKNGMVYEVSLSQISATKNPQKEWDIKVILDNGERLDLTEQSHVSNLAMSSQMPNNPINQEVDFRLRELALKEQTLALKEQQLTAWTRQLYEREQNLNASLSVAGHNFATAGLNPAAPANAHMHAHQQPNKKRP